MKKIFTVILFFVLSLFLLLGGVFLSKDLLLTIFLPKIVSSWMGARVEVKSVSLSLSEQSVLIEGARFYNPPGFPEETMVLVPTIQARVDIDALFRKRLYMPFLKVDFERVDLFINPKRKNNIQALIDIRRLRREQALAARPARPRSVKPWSFQIDHLSLVLGAVFVKDYSVLEKPTITPYYVFRYQGYQNISDVQHLGALLLADAIKMANVKGVTLIGISSLSNAMLSPVKKVGSSFGLEPLVDTAQSGASSLTKTLFLPFEATGRMMGGGTIKIKLGVDLDRVYEGVVSVLKQRAMITKEDKRQGTIVAKFQNTTISVRLKGISGGTELAVSATEWSQAKPHFARGLIYFLVRDLEQDDSAHTTKSLFMK